MVRALILYTCTYIAYIVNLFVTQICKTLLYGLGSEFRVFCVKQIEFVSLEEHHGSRQSKYKNEMKLGKCDNKNGNNTDMCTYPYYFHSCYHICLVSFRFCTLTVESRDAPPN